MKELKYGVPDVAVRNRDSATPKRSFFKLAAPALATLLSLTAPAVVMTVAHKAVAQDVEICGRKVEVVKLDKSVAQMDKETKPFREREFSAKESGDGEYMNSVHIPNTVTLIVSTDKNKWVVDVLFNKELDRTGTSGTRRLDISDFSQYVNRLANQKMERAYIVLETGTFEYEGKNTEFVTAHIYPLNKEGKPITRMAEGDLTFDVSYFEGNIGNGTSLLVEPNAKRSNMLSMKLNTSN